MNVEMVAKHDMTGNIISEMKSAKWRRFLFGPYLDQSKMAAILFQPHLG